MWRCGFLAHTPLFKWQSNSYRSAHGAEYHHLYIPQVLTPPSIQLFSNSNSNESSIANMKGFNKHQLLQLEKSQKKEYLKKSRTMQVYCSFQLTDTHTINCCSRQWSTDLTAPANVLQPCNILQPTFLSSSFFWRIFPLHFMLFLQLPIAPVLMWTDHTYAYLKPKITQIGSTNKNTSGQYPCTFLWPW